MVKFKGFGCFPVSRHFPNSVTPPLPYSKDLVVSLFLDTFGKGWKVRTFPSELSAIGAKWGVWSLPVRTASSHQSILAKPAEGRPRPSGDDGDDDDSDDHDHHGAKHWGREQKTGSPAVPRHKKFTGGTRSPHRADWCTCPVGIGVHGRVCI